jgi:plastocyanin
MSPPSKRAVRARTARRAVLVLVACVAVAAPAAALASSGGHTARTHIVTLQGLRFHPATLTVNVGDTVTWEWRDGGIEHNVTGTHFHSRTQGNGSFTVRFTHKGTFSYHCTIHVHEGMVGKVIVH